MICARLPSKSKLTYADLPKGKGEDLESETLLIPSDSPQTTDCSCSCLENKIDYFVLSMRSCIYLLQGQKLTTKQRW